MNEKIRLESKKEDKKFLGKFLIILACSFVIGTVAGLGMTFLEDAKGIPDLIATSVKTVMLAIAPYVSLVFVVVMGTVLLITHKTVSEKAAAWDGENEEEYEKMDTLLGNAMYALGIGMVLVYFFFAVGFENIAERTGFADGCYIFGFIAAMILIVGGQSALVKLTKELNPEKKGSVYDMNFIDKWEDSCDEAEKIMIYKSAYKTYTKMSGIFVALWIFCIFGSKIFGFGMMPVTMVSILWMCEVCFYTHYSKYYSKHPDKVGVFK